MPAALAFASLHQPLARTKSPAAIRKLSRCGSIIPEMEHSRAPNSRNRHLRQSPMEGSAVLRLWGAALLCVNWCALQGCANNPSPRERTASLLHSREDSGAFEMTMTMTMPGASGEHYQRGEPTFPVPPIASLKQSRRHRHLRRLAPYFPSSKPRRKTCCPVAWRRCRCAPSPIHRMDAALRAVHRSCLLRQ